MWTLTLALAGACGGEEGGPAYPAVAEDANWSGLDDETRGAWCEARDAELEASLDPGRLRQGECALVAYLAGDLLDEASSTPDAGDIACEMAWQGCLEAALPPPRPCWPEDCSFTLAEAHACADAWVEELEQRAESFACTEVDWSTDQASLPVPEACAALGC